MSHTKGRWLASKSKHGIDAGHHLIAVVDPDADDRSILIHAAGEAGDPYSDAERIVACVEACAGISTDTLKKSGLTTCRSGAELILADQLVDVLSALKGLLSLHEPQGRFQPSHYKPFLFKACAAIAKVDPEYKPSQAYDDVATAVEQRDDLLEALKLFGLDIGDDLYIARLEFGPVAVDRELKRRAAIAKCEDRS